MKPLCLCCCLLLTSSVHADDELTPAEQIGLEIGRDTTVITGPINEFGYPDHLRWLDAQMAEGVAPDENFWVGMWQACGNMDLSSSEHIHEVEVRLGISIGLERKLVGLHDLYGDDEARLQVLYDHQNQVSQRPWTRDEFPEIAEWLDSNAEVLALVREACARPKAYSPLISGEGASPLISVLLPHVQQTREVARLLSARAMLKLGEGDSAGAWEDLLTSHRLAHHLGKGWTMIERLVGVAIHAIAQQPTCHWLSQSDLSPEDLLAHWEELAPAIEPISFAECVDVGERFMFIDTVLALQTGVVSSRELFPMFEPSAVLSDGGSAAEDEMSRILSQLHSARFRIYDLVLFGADINETLRYGNRMYDEFHQAMSSPVHLERIAMLTGRSAEQARNESIASSPESLLAEYFLASDEEFEQLPARMMTGMLTPAVRSCEEAQTRMEGKVVSLQAAFAVKIAMATTGEIPESLAAVASLGDAVPAIPRDPFTGGELHMHEDFRGIVIYSFGTDGEDDLGFTWGDHPDGGTDYDDQRAIITLAP